MFETSVDSTSATQQVFQQISIVNRQGKLCGRILGEDDGGHLQLFNAQGQCFVDLRAGDEGGTLALSDEDGRELNAISTGLSTFKSGVDECLAEWPNQN